MWRDVELSIRDYPTSLMVPKGGRLTERTWEKGRTSEKKKKGAGVRSRKPIIRKPLEVGGVCNAKRRFGIGERDVRICNEKEKHTAGNEGTQGNVKSYPLVSHAHEK